MINILYITPNFTIGGTEGQIFNLATHLDRSLFTSYVISIGSDHGQRELYSNKHIETRVFKIFDIFNIVSFIKEKKIDIIHSFYYGDFSGWDLIVAKMSGIKIFITSRRNMGYWRKWRHVLFDIFRNTFTDTIIANSYAVKEKTIADERFTPSGITVIYNGIDLAIYGRSVSPEERQTVKKEMGIDVGDKVIGMISNVKHIKGYEYFMNAARLIKDWGYKTKFIIAGEGSENQAFRDIAGQYGLGDSLILLGLCNNVVKIFSVVDIFMYSSLSEGFPNVILEAMAAGKPIVATDVGGTKEMLRDGYSGLLVPPQHAKALARAVTKILDDDIMMEDLRQTARESVMQHFSMEKCVGEYESTYEKLFHNKTKATRWIPQVST